VQAQICTDTLLEKHFTARGVPDFIVISCKYCVFVLVKCFVLKACVYYIFIMPRKCLNHPVTFCYVCGEMTFKSQRQNFTLLVKKCYNLCFGCKVGDKHKSLTPHICCVMCVRFLAGWVNDTHQMPFSVLMVWREQKDHSSNCHFCFTNITGIMWDMRLPP